MQANRKDIIEIIVLTTLFFIITAISYFHVQASISIFKYLFGSSITYLLLNYDVYHHSFKDFLFNTTSFQPGAAESGGHSVVYLFPLFVFCDLFGGLSLKLIYLFNIGASLIFLILFYGWVRRSWGREAAFFAAFFLGFSAVFQELARSGGFVGGYSLLITMVWMFYCYHGIGREKPFYFGVFGFLTAMLWYVYGVARPLTLVAFARAWWGKPKSRWVAFGLLTGVMILIFIPAIIFIFQQRTDYHGPWHKLFIDKENIFDDQGGDVHRIFVQSLDNLRVFWGRMTGAEQIIDFPMRWLPHAHFLSPFLVIPMLIGARQTIRLWKRPENQLLIVAAVMIYLTPLMTSGGGYNEPRRAVLYVIPTYCFIGLGCKAMMDWFIASMHSRLVKGLVLIILIESIGTILFSEAVFFQRNIISSSRDLGLLEFVDKIKGMGLHGDIYYLESGMVYNADIMHLALMDGGKIPFNMKSGHLQGKPPDFSGNFYVVSFGIPEEVFERWSLRNNLKYSLVLDAPLINSPDPNNRIWTQWCLSYDVNPFKIYSVYRL